VSEENVEIVRRVLGIFNEGGVDAVPLDLLDPELTFGMPPEQPDPGVFRGRDVALAALREWSESWETQHSEIERVIDQGDRVVVLTRETLLGRDRIEVDQRSGNVVTFKDGKILRWDAYWDQGRALRAAGLEG
jgi:ketosteroid isomerase-like protein